MASQYIIDSEHFNYDQLIDDVTSRVVTRLITNGSSLGINQNEIVDNLDSVDSNKALSANMGKQIKENIQSLVDQIYNNIVDNVTSISPNHFLSARMGNQLNERIRKIENMIIGNTIASTALPSGIICMWSGTIADIPRGWILCDGSNGTPDLRDKFVKSIPSRFIDPGTIDGANYKSLVIDNIPQHSHNIRHTHSTRNHTHTNEHQHRINIITNPDGEHSHRFASDNTIWLASLYRDNEVVRLSNNSNGTHVTSAALYHSSFEDFDHIFSNATKKAAQHDHNVVGLTDKSDHTTGETNVEVIEYNNISEVVGKGDPFDNRPIFYEIAFIMKL